MATPELRVTIGTAGHIDHGKTSLIRKLTGRDTDRLPEERKRGITIVLGFAPIDLGEGIRAGVVDVPGHERFVKNMVAGAGGIDLVLMVIAADEGVMPQTREHLEICQLLGTRSGLIALTKTDKAGEELVELAKEDVAESVAGTFLEGAPIIPCSSHTGEGIEDVRTELRRAVLAMPARDEKSSALLPIDRCFTVKGFGSIVTGTMLSGRLGVGDNVDVLPHVPGHEMPKGGARLRSIQVFGESTEECTSGQRSAINLQGVALEQLALGQVIVNEGAAVPTRRVAVEIQHLSSRKKKLKTGAPILFHTGTALVEGRVTLTDCDALEPSEIGFGLIRLKEPVATLIGQRFIARGFESIQHAGRTIAGGVILDCEPDRLRRKREVTTQVLAALRAFVEPGAPKEQLGQTIQCMVTARGRLGLDISALARRLAKPVAKVRSAAQSGAAPDVVIVSETLIANRELATLEEKIEAAIRQFQTDNPYRNGVATQELASSLRPRTPTHLIEHVLRAMLRTKKLTQTPEGVCTAGHRGKADAGTVDKIVDILEKARLTPPTMAELESEANMDSRDLKEALSALARSRRVVRAGSLCFGRRAFDDAKTSLLAHIREKGSITTPDAKTLFGISRKYLIPLLEAFDKEKITVRVGDVRKAKPGAFDA